MVVLTRAGFIVSLWTPRHRIFFIFLVQLGKCQAPSETITFPTTPAAPESRLQLQRGSGVVRAPCPSLSHVEHHTAADYRAGGVWKRVGSMPLTLVFNSRGFFTGLFFQSGLLQMPGLSPRWLGW